MKMRYSIIALLLFTLCQGVFAQAKLWTLEECINYAIDNNITLQRQKLQSENARINLLKSKLDVLPSLNMGSDASVQFGRSIDPRSNLITFSQNLRNGYDISSNIKIFNGFATMNTIAANKFMLLAGIENEKVTKNTLIIDIMGQYYQVLYARGLENASKMQLDLSEKQLFRIQKMVETGKEALSKQYEMESRLSADKLSYTVAQNNSNQALTTLKQMLQIEHGSEFEIMMPDLNAILISDISYKIDSIFSIASQVLPRLKGVEYELRASRKQLSAARGAQYPSISGGGSLFTGYYTALKDTSKGVPFREQLNNNFGQSIYMSLNIPIFNNYSTARSIKRAKIQLKDSELKLEQEKNNLFTEIENACLNYNRGKDEYAAAGANFEYNKKSFSVVEKKFESGLVDVTDYSAAKTTLFSAETEALRTKLQLLIRKLTIQFYTTGEYQNTMKN